MPEGTFAENEFVTTTITNEVLHKGAGVSQGLTEARGIPLLGGFIESTNASGGGTSAEHFGFNGPADNGAFSQYTARVKVTTTRSEDLVDNGIIYDTEVTTLESIVQISAFSINYYTLDAMRGSFDDVLAEYDTLEREYSSESLFINVSLAIQSEEDFDNGVPREESWIVPRQRLVDRLL